MNLWASDAITRLIRELWICGREELLASKRSRWLHHLLGCPVWHQNPFHIHVTHFRYLFAQNANDLVAHIRLPPQQFQQFSPWNELQLAIPGSFGCEAVWLSREGRRQANDAPCAHNPAGVKKRIISKAHSNLACS